VVMYVDALRIKHDGAPVCRSPRQSGSDPFLPPDAPAIVYAIYRHFSSRAHSVGRNRTYARRRLVTSPAAFH
jgi:hypothetical protein